MIAFCQSKLARALRDKRGCVKSILTLQAIHNLEQEIGAYLRRFVLGAFQVDPCISILDLKTGCLGRRRQAMTVVTTEAHVASRTMPPVVGAVSGLLIRPATHYPLIIRRRRGWRCGLVRCGWLAGGWWGGRLLGKRGGGRRCKGKTG
ncbi:hypothetical protein HJC04_06615 [Rhizobium sp. NLR8a]|nr:hypothetical protein [Rhizobium sp. NLR8a]